ncbi:ribosomal protein L43, putative [Ixodes scapularis]|uniref:Large ribosomal subunit protein mL43 n=1 Tax=Ixodes scapularis TaxID=6945 RepID=B7P0T9_IXOSC|nr:ribosomal protein L43, putative [Ixodes scapularis]|eukprot:XP_002399365.1 ribosomal protein L43, putative [Ixodes scapularis]
MAHKASGYIKTTLNNGVGRYVCQLQRLTFKFCKTHGSSRGLREYIEKELVDFARQNPGIVVYLKPRRHRDPVVVAEYLNGERDTMRVADQSSAELVKWIEYLRTRSGMPIVRLRKFAHTDHPSIQAPAACAGQRSYAGRQPCSKRPEVNVPTRVEAYTATFVMCR